MNMKLTVSVKNAAGETLASATGEGRVFLEYKAAYQPGDVLCLASDEAGYVVAQLEDSLPETFGRLNAEARLPIPFEERRICYSPKCFVGEEHLIWARCATEAEISARRNLALNPLDCHANSGLFPHATANVETRGEASFEARNAIDGIYANEGHGVYPYSSWGINRDPGAALTIDFGRAVTVDEVVVTLRNDFPHDNWWQSAVIRFDDGSSETLHFEKVAYPQHTKIAPRTVRTATLEQLIQCPDDPSPFPALTQLEVWGTEA